MDELTKSKLAWLDRGPERPDGSVVHTLLDGKPVRAERVEGEWVVKPEGWVHE